MASVKRQKYLSVILPVYNEEDNIKLQYENLVVNLKPLKISYEIIFIDDGSNDDSFNLLSGIAEKDKNVKLVSFRRNFGQTAAIAAGIDYSSGKIIIIMDADLQNDAEDIKRMIEKIDEGYDVVSGWRKDRKDRFLSRVLISKIGNWMISKISGVKINDLGSSQAYRGEVLKQVKIYGEMHRFIPIHASWIGAKITEIPVKHHPRKFGKSKYGLIRTFKVLLDLTTLKFLGSFSTKPIYLFGGIGFFLLFSGGLSFIATVIMKFTIHQTMNRNPLLYLTIMLVLLSVMFIVLGILAELLIRVYHEARQEKQYKVRKTMNI